MKHPTLTSRTTLAVVTALALAACGHEYSDDRDLGTLQADVETARDEVLRHHHAVMVEDSLAELPVEMDRYEAGMGSIMDDMGTSMDGVTFHCSHRSLSSMRQRWMTLGSVMESHQTRMSSARSLPDAVNACNTHAEAVMLMLDDMEDAVGGMSCMSHR